MSLKDVITTLGGEQPDPQAVRRPVLDDLARARRAFDGRGDGVPADGWFSTSDPGQVAFAPKRPDGQPIVVGGQPVTFWTEEEFTAVLDAFGAALENGEVDGQLTGATPAGSSLPLADLTARMRDAAD